MDLDTSNVSYDFKQEPADHAGHITPCFVLDTEEDLGNEENTKDGEKEDVPRQVRDVFKVCIVHGACR